MRAGEPLRKVYVSDPSSIQEGIERTVYEHAGEPVGLQVSRKELRAAYLLYSKACARLQVSRKELRVGRVWLLAVTVVASIQEGIESHLCDR